MALKKLNMAQKAYLQEAANLAERKRQGFVLY